MQQLLCAARRTMATVARRKDLPWKDLTFQYYPTAHHVEFTHKDGKVESRHLLIDAGFKRRPARFQRLTC